MAADSQASEMAGGMVMKLPAAKIHQLTDQIIWGASGSVGVMQDVESALSEWLPDAQSKQRINTTPIAKLKSDLVRIISAPVTRAHQSYVPIPNTLPSQPFTSFLFCGVTGPNNFPWILEIDPHCNSQRYDELGFHAVGSGGDMARLAHATLLHYNLRERLLNHGRVVAYRMMDSVISSIETVGYPIHMWVQDGVKFRELDQAEMDAVRATVGGWKEIERESLDEALGMIPTPPSD